MEKTKRKNNFRKVVAFTLVMAMVMSLAGIGAGFPGSGSSKVYAGTEDITVNVRVEGYDSTFLPLTEVTVSAGATAWQAISKVAMENDIDILINEGYINSVSKGGIVWASSNPDFKPVQSNAYNMSGWVYRINDQSAGMTGVSDMIIADGDRITLAYGAYGDYGFFENSEYYGVEGSPLAVKLKKDTWGTIGPVAEADIYAYEDSASSKTVLATTDSNGEVILTFQTAGSYQLTGEKKLTGYLAIGEINTITRPFTKITVITEQEMHDKVVSDAASLSISYNGMDSTLKLPTTGASGTSIVWDSSDTSIIDNEGRVKRPVCGAGDAYVTMSAIIGNVLYDQKRDFPLIVREYTEEEVEAALTGMQAWDIPKVLITGSKVYVGTASQDNQIKFIWKSSKPEVIGEEMGTWGDLQVHQPNIGELKVPVTLTVAAISGNVTKYRTFNVEVAPLDNNAKAAELSTLINGIASDVQSNNRITEHMSYGSEWVQAMVSAGKIEMISSQDRSNYLAMAMEEAQSDRTNIGKKGKIIVGLTALGIDPRKIPGKTAGETINLVENLYASGDAMNFGSQYEIPYVLMAYNLNYNPIESNRTQVINDTINKMFEIEGGSLSNENFYNAWAADSIGIFSTVLSQYYETNTTAQGIINRGLIWLKDTQASGTFGNANSDAMVVLGLSPLMENSALLTSNEDLLHAIGNGLLAYKTNDGKGFAYYGNYNLLATVQGFQAITAYRNHLTEAAVGTYMFDYPTTNLEDKVNWPVEKFPMDIKVTPPTNTIFNKGEYVDASSLDYVVTATYLDGTSSIIPNSLCSVSYIDTSTTGAKEVRVTYLGKVKTFTVIVRDSATTVSTKESILTIRGTSVSSEKTVINNSSTVLSVLEEICALKDIDVLTYKGYVSSMNGKAEFDEGPNSGWLYQVNGNTPSSTAAGEYKLTGGENIVWYYTLDFTKDSSSNAWVNPTVTGGAITGGAITGSAVTATFNDISGHWAEEYIEYLAARGIINGKAEGMFMPDDAITRAEFVTILGNKFGADYSKYNGLPFGDVKGTEWFAGAVAWGEESGIITGTDGRFNPNRNISRQEMATILDRYRMKVEKSALTGTVKPVVFADEAEIADYAKTAVDKMQRLGIINGKTSVTFAPKDTATRGEAAKMLAIFMQIPVE